MRIYYDIRLGDNSRMIAILSPTSIHGHSVIFRKWMRHQITWEELLEYLSAAWAAGEQGRGGW